jgi:phenylpyruvate tautomerase PptA (4-oxalocrotonate tautomerase family)
MPIVDVEVVGPLARSAGRGLAGRVADAVGAVLAAPPGHTWVRLRRLASSDYAESDGGPPRGVRPVFVALLRQRPPTGRALAREVRRLTLAVAQATGRPSENVHVVYRSSPNGRAAFGGRLI